MDIRLCTLEVSGRVKYYIWNPPLRYGARVYGSGRIKFDMIQINPYRIEHTIGIL